MSLEHVKKMGRSYSVQEVGFFEGTEKLLEMWFDVLSTGQGLRSIPRSVVCVA